MKYSKYTLLIFTVISVLIAWLMFLLIGLPTTDLMPNWVLAFFPSMCIGGIVLVIYKGIELINKKQNDNSSPVVSYKEFNTKVESLRSDLKSMKLVIEKLDKETKRNALNIRYLHLALIYEKLPNRNIPMSHIHLKAEFNNEELKQLKAEGYYINVRLD